MVYLNYFYAYLSFSSILVGSITYYAPRTNLIIAYPNSIK